MRPRDFIPLGLVDCREGGIASVLLVDLGQIQASRLWHGDAIDLASAKYKVAQGRARVLR